jgi:hypothetical protein
MDFNVTSSSNGNLSITSNWMLSQFETLEKKGREFQFQQFSSDFEKKKRKRKMLLLK